MTTYIDIDNTIQRPETGRRPKAEWGDAIHTNCEFFRTDKPMLVKYDIPLHTLADGETTPLTLQVGTADNSSWHDEDEPSLLRCPMTGLYLICAQLTYNSNSSGRRLLTFQVNGSLIGARGEASVVTNHTASASFIFPLREGDTFEVIGYQSSGGNLNTNIAGSCLSIAWVGGYR